MADIKNLKITEDKTRGKHVADLPVNPTENGMSAQELQGHFDALPEVVIEAFNTLLDYLVANGAGDKITPLSLWAMQNNFGNLTCTDLLEWIDQQPIGGAFNLNPEVTTTGTPVTGSWQKGVFFVNSDDSKTVFICDTSSGHIFYNFSVSIGNWKGWKDFSGDFKSDGSVSMTGAISTSGDGTGVASYAGNVAGAFIECFNGNWSNRRQLLMCNPQYMADIATSLQLVDVPNAKYYNIFGEHNKPSGSYTGNGSETKRTIPTGGIGHAVLIEYGAYSVILTGATSIISTGSSMKSLPWSNGYFDGSNIVLATTDAALNTNGVEYKWHVL